MAGTGDTRSFPASHQPSPWPHLEPLTLGDDSILMKVRSLSNGRETAERSKPFAYQGFLTHPAQPQCGVSTKAKPQRGVTPIAQGTALGPPATIQPSHNVA